MAEVGGASCADRKRRRAEWPTWTALFGCYAVWATAVYLSEPLGWAMAIPLALATAFHSSLQHEILHGHPTRSAQVNEALVFLPLGLFIPYRRFRDLHIWHHNDERLTDPYDDPESFYIEISTWRRLGAPFRLLLLANSSFAGRMLFGPSLSIAGFVRSETWRLWQGEQGVRRAWGLHALGLVPVLAILHVAGISLWFYTICVAYPAMSLIMMRSYIEHRAAEAASHRSVFIEEHWFWRLMFLNNNFHSVHHSYPAVPWYRIPAIWRREQSQVLMRNGGYYYPGYGTVVVRWLFTQREPLVHPYVGHTPAPETPC